jgi:hypothetical protein
MCSVLALRCPDRYPVIPGRGDQVGVETSEDNMHAMIEAGRALGRVAQ